MIALEDQVTEPVEPVKPVELEPVELGQLFYALGDLDGSTMSILAFLKKGSKTVTEIAKHINKSDSATSQRLSKLRMQNLVTARGESTKRFYSVNSVKLDELLSSINHVLGS